MAASGCCRADEPEIGRWLAVESSVGADGRGGRSAGGSQLSAAPAAPSEDGAWLLGWGLSRSVVPAGSLLLLPPGLTTTLMGLLQSTWASAHVWSPSRSLPFWKNARSDRARFILSAKAWKEQESLLVGLVLWVWSRRTWPAVDLSNHTEKASQTSEVTAQRLLNSLVDHADVDTIVWCGERCQRVSFERRRRYENTAARTDHGQTQAERPRLLRSSPSSDSRRRA